MRTSSPRILRQRRRARRTSPGRLLATRAILTLPVLSIIVGCAKPPPPFVPLVERDLRIHCCFDGIPHQAGTKPFLLGGTCCCTPTPALMQAYARDGVCAGMSAEDLIAQYRARGIQLAIDHTGCNNLCPWGPHVTRGGSCMAAPTPGTRNYQEIVMGRLPGRAAEAAPADKQIAASNSNQE